MLQKRDWDEFINRTNLYEKLLSELSSFDTYQ